MGSTSASKAMVAGKKKKAAMLTAREDAAAKKATKVRDLVKIDGRCKKLGVTEVKPQQNYGSSVVGADENNIKSQKRNMAVATGKGLSPGTSPTVATVWTYGEQCPAEHNGTYGPCGSMAQVL